MWRDRWRLTRDGAIDDEPERRFAGSSCAITS
jgi:hypothetical protein